MEDNDQVTNEEKTDVFERVFLKPSHNIRRVETTYDIDRIFTQFLSQNVFFSSIARRLKRIATFDIPTCAVGFDRGLDTFVFYWNPKMFSAHGDTDVTGFCHHEIYHVVFNHLSFPMSQLMNIAQDLAINSLIVYGMSKGEAERAKQVTLPGWVIVPGRTPTKLNFDTDFSQQEYSDDEIAKNPLLNVVASLPPHMGSMQYYYALQQSGISEQYVCEFVMSDDHKFFGDEGKEHDEYVSARLRSIIENAAKEAETSNSWGNIPQEIVKALKEALLTTVGWEAVLKNFVGTLARGKKTSTIKRVNSRFPYQHPGTRRGRQAKLLVAIDESGSVDNDMLSRFFVALGKLSHLVEVDVVPFDCECRIEDVETWKKVTPTFERKRSGGTNFNAPTALVNDDLNRGRWDALLILTDGEAPQPGQSRVQRAWCYPQGHKLMFETNELKIELGTSGQLNEII